MCDKFISSQEGMGGGGGGGGIIFRHQKAQIKLVSRLVGLYTYIPVYIRT